MQNKPFLNISHNDADGGVSAICVLNHIKQKYGPEAVCNFHFATYSNVEQYVERIMDNPEKFEQIFITDIYVSKELAMEFPDNIRLWDHHQSSENLVGVKNCTIDTSGKICAAVMCLKYLLKKEGLEYNHLAKLVAIVNDYDIYTNKLPNKIAKNLNFIYYHYWGEKFIERFKNGFDGFNKEEQDVIDKKWADIALQIKNTKFIDMMENDPVYKNKFCIIPVSDNKDGEVNELCEYALKTLNYDIVMFANCKKRKISTRISSNAVAKGLHIGNFHMDLKLGRWA
jgi:oligoribonuclease NrnB/cAMP/cGMP phosphodiesterase (DHH superfamily)